MTRRDFLKRLGWAGACVAGLGAGVGAEGWGVGGRGRKVVVLGYDGLDAALVERWMREGHLPNLARLASEGHYARSLSTNPAESPVAWSTIITGMNPGKTGVYDFLRRDPNTYRIEYAVVAREREDLGKVRWGARLAGVATTGGLTGWAAHRAADEWGRRHGYDKERRKWLASGAAAVTAAVVGVAADDAIKGIVPRAKVTGVNERKGVPFWEVAAERGVSACALGAPICFPAEGGRAKMLCGLGVPDIRGTQGTYSIYTNEVAALTDTEMGGKLIPVSVGSDGVINSHIIGPRNLPYDSPQEEIRVPLQVRLDRTARRAEIRVQGQRQVLGEGEWGRWLRVRFHFSPIVSVHGIARFLLQKVEPDFRLYLAPICLDPWEPPAPICSPGGYSRELAEKLGAFRTLGWEVDTWAYNEGQIDTETFLEDLEYSFDERERLTLEAMEESEARLLVSVLYGTDYAQHVTWRLFDPSHPAYREKEAKKYGGTILDCYRRADDFVGKVQGKLGEDGALLVVSDHGFAPFRRAVNINTWLVEKGYMGLKGGNRPRERRLEDLFAEGEFWPDVDWSRTKAYALGLGQIYLNVAGREGEGIVKAADYYHLREKIASELKDFRDPATGERVCRGVYRGEDLYHGPEVGTAPDVVVGFNRGYRVSWQTCLGGAPGGLVEENDRRWSGDHCSVDPGLIPGVIFSSVPLTRQGQARVEDIAPTVLDLAGVERPGGMDGESLL